MVTQNEIDKLINDQFQLVYKDAISILREILTMFDDLKVINTQVIIIVMHLLGIALDVEYDKYKDDIPIVCKQTMNIYIAIEDVINTFIKKHDLPLKFESSLQYTGKVPLEDKIQINQEKLNNIYKFLKNIEKTLKKEDGNDNANYYYI